MARVDFNLPSPQEIAKLGTRYGRSSGGNAYRTWQPSKYRGAAVRKIVFERDGFTCQECGTRSEFEGEFRGQYLHDLQLDHVIPYRDGGLFYPGNLQALCPSCNYRKGAN